MPEKAILVVAGNPSVGKDSYCQHLVETHGAVIFSPGDAIRKFATENDLPRGTREDLRIASLEMERKLGKTSLAEAVRKSEADFICLPGTRRPVLQDAIHALGGKTLALWGSVYTRYQNSLNDPLRDRGRNIREFWLEEMQEYFNADPNMSATITVMQTAHYHLSIEGKSLEQIFVEADELVLPDLLSTTSLSTAG